MNKYSICVIFVSLLIVQRVVSQNSDEWGEWSQCSRTCGVGVSYQDRKCLDVTDDASKSCPEPRRKYRTCNIQDCPEGSGDYRYEQCAKYNNKKLEGKKYKWVPYIPDHDICGLNCMPKGEFFYYRWSAKVVDGTRCSPDSYDICVNGKCEPLGCDLIMHSKAKEDKCRVCNGNGENCRTITGEYKQVGDGYKEFLVIPRSATNIVITEAASAGHFLALADEKGNFFFNGDFDITNPRTYKIAGSLFRYERSSSGLESIRSLGPTNEPVHALILLREGAENPGVKYEFSVPNSIKVLPSHAQFKWKVGAFGSCSASCAGGRQYRTVSCIRDRDQKEVRPNECDPSKKPTTRRKCNSHPCPSRWFISGWSACSVTCGRGKQVRRVHCEHVVEGGDSAMIPDSRCKTTKPDYMRSCTLTRYCPVWSSSSWSECSTSCGEGQVTREVKCQNAAGETVPSDSCDVNSKPKAVARCNPGPCSVKWSATKWSPCYPKCGQGMSTRMVYCVSATNKNQKYPSNLCNQNTKPPTSKKCANEGKCPAMWHGSQWSRCTSSCGTGMQMRNVICAFQDGEMLRIISNNNCNTSYSMPSVRKCFSKPCHSGWFIFPWKPCSRSCGIGIRRRDVKCLADSKEVPDERWCDKKAKPTEVEVCLVKQCGSVVKTTTQAPVITQEPVEPATTKKVTEIITTFQSTTEAYTTKRTQGTTERPATTEATTTPKPTIKPTTTQVPTTTEDPATTSSTTQAATTTKTPTTKELTTTKEITTAKEVPTPTTKAVRTTTEQPSTADAQTTTSAVSTTEASTTTEKQSTREPTTKLVLTTIEPTVEETTLNPTTVPSATIKITRRPVTFKPTNTPVQIPATIVHRPRDVVRYVNSQVLLRCRATGSPQPRISWRRGMIPVSALGERYKILEEGTLRIENVRPEDDGKYTCFAGNFVGPMVSASCTLTVIVPVSVKIRPSENVEVQEGEEVALECVSQGKPAPTSYWYKDGGLFIINDERITTTAYKIIIKNARNVDSGNYECRADHAYGSDSDDVTVTVKVQSVSATSKPPPTSVCIDDSSVGNCNLVFVAGFCTNAYYLKACCKTCSSRTYHRL